MRFSDFTFGVEIECYVPRNAGDLYTNLGRAGLTMSRVVGNRHRATAGWKVVPDASLDRAVPTGFVAAEAVSPILKGEEGIAQVALALNTIKALGGKVNAACGLHVHVGMQNATPAQMRNLAKMFVRYEHHFDMLCPLSRRDNYFAKSTLNKAAGSATGEHAIKVATAFARIDSTRTVSGLANVLNGGYDERNHYTPFRYYKMNLQSMASHGTIEFRQAAGTVEAAKAVAWVRLVVGLAASAFSVRSVTAQDIPTFSKLMRKVDSPTAEYLRARRVALNSGVELED
jgi:hypothetical protein